MAFEIEINDLKKKLSFWEEKVKPFNKALEGIGAHWETNRDNNDLPLSSIHQITNIIEEHFYPKIEDYDVIQDIIYNYSYNGYSELRDYLYNYPNNEVSGYSLQDINSKINILKSEIQEKEKRSKKTNKRS